MKTLIQLTAIFLLISGNSFAQTSKQDGIWISMKYFIGEWTGKGEGHPETGNY